MRYALDTNVVVYALNGHPAVTRRLNSILSRDRAILPAVALAELRYGALSSQRVAENLARIDRLLDVVVFAPVDQAVAERFATIKSGLRQRGLSKSDADLLIAATALELDATLVTSDRALQDGAIQDLRIEDWATSS